VVRSLFKKRKNTHVIGALGGDAVYRRAGDQYTLWRKIDQRHHATVQYDPAMEDWTTNGVRVEAFDPAEEVEMEDP
jgi:hypothetical protein